MKFFQKGFLGVPSIDPPQRVEQAGVVETLLITAKARLQVGWIQGDLYSSEGVCAIGAVEVTYHDYRAREVALNLLKESLPRRWRLLGRLCGKEGVSVIAGFNDAPWRRQRRVEQLYDRAIAEAHRKGVSVAQW